MDLNLKSLNEYHQIRTIRNSKAWMYTFEFWIQGNKVWVQYNNSDPMEFKQILTSKFYPEVKELLQTIAEYIKDNSLKYPLLDASLPWPKVIIDFIQKYFKRKDERMDVIMKSNGDIILNLEESMPYLKPYKSVYFVEEIRDDYCIDDELEEGIKKKFVIRNGKKTIKYYSTNKQYGVKGTGSKKKLVRKKPSETRKKSIIAKKSARKIKSKQTATNRKRKISMKKHTW